MKAVLIRIVLTVAVAGGILLFPVSGGGRSDPSPRPHRNPETGKWEQPPLKSVGMPWQIPAACGTLALIWGSAFKKEAVVEE